MEPRKGRRKQGNFKPDQEFISNAVEKFLKKGGRITKIHNHLDEFHHIYRSELAMNISDLEEIRI